MESKIDSFERIDRMLASAEARRNRRCEALVARVRQAIDDLQDAEFGDLETHEQSGRPLP